MKVTLGQILINDALPAEYRDYSRVMDKKTVDKLMDAVARTHPDEYKDIVHKLHQIGGMAAFFTGHTVSLEDVKPVSLSKEEVAKIRDQIDRVSDEGGPRQVRDDKMLKILGEAASRSEQMALERLRKSNNPLAQEVDSGSRGNATQLNSLVGSPVLVMDHANRPAPVPVVRSYAEGLSPAEYWAQSYGTRRGAVSTKMATADSGFLGKQLALAAHKLKVTDDPATPGVGLPVEADDPDNEGSVLAQSVGKYPAGTIITADMIKNWPAGTKEILVRSAVSDIAKDGGVPRLAAGIRDKGRLPDVGENIGISAVHTISEKLSQGALNVKHTGGAGSSGARAGGFKTINQLMQVPKVFPSGAAHAMEDGKVTAITKLPQGGVAVEINGNGHFVDVDQKPLVKVGDDVEAGDALSDGLPNPAAIVQHKGVGEGRRYFMNLIRDVFANSGISTHRRNLELLSRSLINHVQIDDAADSIPGAVPGDIMEYDRVAANYEPRDGSVTLPAAAAKGGYLERPVLHYSIGTKITPSVVNKLKDHKIGSVTIHKDPPGFKPVMQRAMTNLLTTPDWMERLGGFYIQKGFLDSVHRGGSADLKGSSFIPAMVAGQNYGDDDE